jgi:hypothetical protein
VAPSASRNSRRLVSIPDSGEGIVMTKTAILEGVGIELTKHAPPLARGDTILGDRFWNAAVPA